MSRLTIQLFGRMHVSCHGQSIRSYRSSKVQALFIYLLLESKRIHTREALMELLWPGLPEKSARDNLRQTLYLLRKTLSATAEQDGEPVSLVYTEHDTIQIQQDGDYTLDTQQFEKLFSAIERHPHNDLGSCRGCYDALKQALQLVTGTLVDGFSLVDSNQFEDWLMLQRENFKRQQIALIGKIITCLFAQKRFHDAVFYVQQWLEIDNKSESAFRYLMQAYLFAGRRSEGLKTYTRLRQMLVDEWGVEPSSATKSIFVQLKGGQHVAKPTLPMLDQHQHTLQPFVAGPPITDARQFFGRKREITRLKHWLQHYPLSHIALIGERRSGKTSLLHYLKHTLPEMQWVLVDFQDPRMRNLSTLLQHLLTGFGIAATGTINLERFMEAVCHHQWQTPTVVVMDELEGGLSAPELTQEFWWMLRALVNSAAVGQLAFVVAAHDSPIYLAEQQEKTSPFFNIFSTLPLHAFTETEACELIASGGGDFSAETITYIIQKSQCWPLLVQILCQERRYALDNHESGSLWKQLAAERMEPYLYLLNQHTTVA